MRLAEAGPWWDTHPAPPHEPPDFDDIDLAALEAELDDVAEHRPALQAQARTELAAEHYPLTRTHGRGPRRPDPPSITPGRRMTVVGIARLLDADNIVKRVSQVQ